MNANKALKEFNAHLRNEVHEHKAEKSDLKDAISTLLERNQELEDELKKEKKRSQNFFTEMLRAQCERDDLKHEVARTKEENAALKLKSSIYTDPVKCRKLKQEGTEHDNT